MYRISKEFQKVANNKRDGRIFSTDPIWFMLGYPFFLFFAPLSFQMESNEIYSSRQAEKPCRRQFLSKTHRIVNNDQADVTFSRCRTTCHTHTTKIKCTLAWQVVTHQSTSLPVVCLIQTYKNNSLTHNLPLIKRVSRGVRYFLSQTQIIQITQIKLIRCTMIRCRQRQHAGFLSQHFN